MQAISSRKRLREEKGSFPGKRCLRMDTADIMMDEASLVAIALMREARRSDNSDTSPAAENFDEDSPEVPAAGAVAGQKLGVPQHPLRGQMAVSLSGRPFSVHPVPVAHSSHSLPGLGKLSMLELQHQLVLLGSLEQELLGELRSARREYDVRVALLGGGLGPIGRITADLVPNAPSTIHALQRGILQQQQRALARSPAFASASDAIPLAASAGGEAPASSSREAMPPPPPRARRGPRQANLDQVVRAETQECVAATAAGPTGTVNTGAIPGSPLGSKASPAIR
ncbi:hypothetical protein Vretimale_17357 [Volvox reticuliferus]|uniref:Uncharacterized protein n=1 Tax=Volvox reticuliferus TaxID=1737510 RepID=A0A8J4GUZ9_9CHLO|nr:hypothetical protein Vretifemale_62 [Volvox reticuliferus]GIM14399.1 hypothetical protein Vretimale_17357 [Volvox reticuliferus]